MMILAACGDRPQGSSSPAPTTGAAKGYDTAVIAADRAMKDAAFQGEGSPFPEGARASFTGLRYYPVDSAYALWLPLEKLEHPDTIRLAATKGDIRTMIRFGRFQFTLGDTRCSLVAYVMPEHPASLFIPFKDATNGAETYEVGRYIDLEMEPTGVFLLDFNKAYNPYCAYNPQYTCPLVPEENILPAHVRAGEKLPPGAGH